VRTLVALPLAGLLVALLLPTVACSDDPPSNEATCNKFKSLCGSATGGIGGSVSLSATCEPGTLDKMANKDDIKECIERAGDCNSAVSCMIGKK
jgi:hypothetical protein